MISNLRISGVNLVVLALFAVAGFVAMCWLAAGAAERLADWWRERERPVDPPWWWKPWLRRRGKFDEDDFDEVGPPGLNLPPERTWEQMTSHQLPVAEHWASGRCWCDQFHRDQVETIALVERPPGILAHLDDPRHERRAPWWEAEHRAAYESLGFDYPSGLMARVRELAP